MAEGSHSDAEARYGTFPPRITSPPRFEKEHGLHRLRAEIAKISDEVEPICIIP